MTYAVLIAEQGLQTFTGALKKASKSFEHAAILARSKLNGKCSRAQKACKALAMPGHRGKEAGLRKWPIN
ncbi:hypothetical protein [Halomonas sp. PR-M31]|uniref:hypothetical protein n=1 Tax=Halomonas sp. PR-M31 TaxID=1471202 RepID=UPI00155B204D|nr:hypothetical protein [Halomonas sp. PR-M31]